MLKNSTNARFCQTACYAQPGIEIYHADNLDLMSMLAAESIDVICIDPPYLYLKGQKLERPFDEQKFFSECERLLKKDGFIIMFGRGGSFYRWNTIVSQLGFLFKEEIIWDKRYGTSPVLPITRVHETITIYTKGNGIINRAKVPYLEQKEYDHESIIADIKRLQSALKNPKSVDLIKSFLAGKRKDFVVKRNSKFNVSLQTEATGEQSVNTVSAIVDGMKEKSIIKILREHYNTIHPTQKPARLIERLLALVVPDHNNVIVADFFAGSMSTMEAVYNLGLKGVAVEIDKKYFEAGKKRIENLPPRQTSFFE